MNKEKVKQAVKELFNALKSNEKFGSEELEDGSILVYEPEELVAGTPIMIQTQSGNIPIPDGEHMLKSGKKFTAKDGLFVAYAEEPTTEPAAVTEITEAVEALKSDLRKEFKAQIESVVEKFNALKSELKETNKVQKESFAKLVDALEETPGTSGRQTNEESGKPMRAWESINLNLKKK